MSFALQSRLKPLFGVLVPPKHVRIYFLVFSLLFISTTIKLSMDTARNSPTWHVQFMKLNKASSQKAVFHPSPIPVVWLIPELEERETCISPPIIEPASFQRSYKECNSLRGPPLSAL